VLFAVAFPLEIGSEGRCIMRISLKRANARAKKAWNDSKAPSVSEVPTHEQVKEEARQIVDERLGPVVDQDGNVWRRTLNGPPPWR